MVCDETICTSRGTSFAHIESAFEVNAAAVMVGGYVVAIHHTVTLHLHHGRGVDINAATSFRGVVEDDFALVACIRASCKYKFGYGGGGAGFFSHVNTATFFCRVMVNHGDINGFHHHIAVELFAELDEAVDGRRKGVGHCERSEAVVVPIPRLTGWGRVDVAGTGSGASALGVCLEIRRIIDIASHIEGVFFISGNYSTGIIIISPVDEMIPVCRRGCYGNFIVVGKATTIASNRAACSRISS